MNLCCMNALLAPSRTPFHHFLALREPNAFSLAHLPRNPWYILRILTIWTSNNPRRIFFCPHFFSLSSFGHAIPPLSGNTTTSRFMVSLPPHLYGSSRGQVSSHKMASPFGLKHSPDFDVQSVKSQSLNFDGVVFVL